MEVQLMLINLVSVPAALILLCLILPPCLVINFFAFISTFFFAEEDVTGKVVLITGASSGIGEHIAYAYARRGACLALAARRENRLDEVAAKAKRLGSRKVLVIAADVSKIDHCKRIVDETINHFGRVDHLINNAGVASSCILENYSDITDMKPLMEINFWGAVYTTKLAIPHLRKSKGRIIAIASPCRWLPTPTATLYNASKAAMWSLFETLRIEVAPDIGITIVDPVFVESEMLQGKHLLKGEEMMINKKFRDVMRLSILRYLVCKADEHAEATVNGICRGKTHLEPLHARALFYVTLLCPQLVHLFLRCILYCN
ncbi:hypothetical protein Dimus_004595 [Dionaea muscipula]